jgi:cytochrome P450
VSATGNFRLILDIKIYSAWLFRKGPPFSYTIQRDPRNCSPDPDSFRPERWLAEREDSEFINNHDTFLPFSTGLASCVVQNLGMLKARMVLAI